MCTSCSSTLLFSTLEKNRRRRRTNMACNSVQTHHLHPFNPHPSTHTPKTLNLTSLNLLPHKSHPISPPPSLKTKTHISFPKSNNGSPFFCSAAQGIGIEETSDNNDQEEFISGEWPENFSLLNYDDLRAHLEPEIFKDQMEPSALLGEVMSTTIRTATVEQRLEEIDHHFEFVSGLPVIDEGFVCIGVISRRDKLKASDGLMSKVGEVMSSPAITLTPNKTVLEAAVLMLKKKLHRIPIVNEGGQVVGMVTRTDIFKALEGLPA